MKIVLVLVITVLLSGCANMIKSGGIHEAQNAITKGEFEEAMENLDIAESFGTLSVEQKAKLHFLRGQALEGLGRSDDAVFSYQYVVEQHGSSPYAGSSQARMEALGATIAN